MTTPDERKTLQVSPAVHEAVYRLASELDTTANGVLRYLLHPYTARVRLAQEQHRLWSAYAAAAGIPLDQWIVQRVEAAIQYGSDPGTMHLVLDHVRALTEHAGITVRRTAPPRRKTEQP